VTTTRKSTRRQQQATTKINTRTAQAPTNKENNRYAFLKTEIFEAIDIQYPMVL
jgi:hypothetical protein